MVEKKLSPDEIAGIISTKEALEKIGQASLINVKALCESLGISRKTAYKYYHQEREKRAKEEPRLKELSSQSGGNKAELEALKKRLNWLEIENEGLKIARMMVEDLKKKGF
jgi:transposase-like protein